MHTLVFIRRTQHHRRKLHCDGCLADGGHQFFFCWLYTFEILLHQRIVEVGGVFHHLVVPLLSLVQEVGRNFLNAVFGAHRFVVPQNGLHLDKVYNTFEVFFCTDRDLYRTRVSTQDILHLLYRFEEIGSRAVHLVHVSNTWNVVLVGLAPYGFRLGLNAVGSRIGSHSTVENAQRAFHLGGKVNVTRSVDKVNLKRLLIIVPVTRRSSRSNGYTTLLFLCHPVHGGCTIVHLTNFVGLTRIEKDTFRSCGLTGINVSHDTDVTSQM